MNKDKIQEYRPISDILKQADLSSDFSILVALWNEVARNKKHYPYHQIYFANEHIRELALKSNAEWEKKFSFYSELYTS